MHKMTWPPHCTCQSDSGQTYVMPHQPTGAHHLLFMTVTDCTYISTHTSASSPCYPLHPSASLCISHPSNLFYLPSILLPTTHSSLLSPSTPPQHPTHLSFTPLPSTQPISSSLHFPSIQPTSPPLTSPSTPHPAPNPPLLHHPPPPLLLPQLMPGCLHRFIGSCHSQCGL